MGSMGDNTPNNPARQTHFDPIIDDDDACTQSPSSYGKMEEEDGNKEEVDWCGRTMPFDDTVPLDETQLLNLYGETQVMEYSDCEDENVRTQLLSDGDGEGTDRTEVLSDGGEESERGEGDCERGVLKGFVMDSDDEVDGERSSGCAQRSCMPVHAASFRQTGRSTDCIMTPKEIDNDTTTIVSNFHSPEKHIDLGDGVDGTRDPTSAGTKLTEKSPDLKSKDCNEDLKGYGDEGKLGVANSTARKFLASDEDNLSANASVIPNGAKEESEFGTFSHDFAGLSYVGSEEPGELSQANAIQAVDKFLSANNLELSQDVSCIRIVKEFSPPSLSAKGPQTLAKRASARNPIREAEIYNWVDSHEDEGGGAFFSKRKETYLGSSGRGRKSRAQAQKHGHLKQAKCIVDEPREMVESLNLQQNITSSNLRLTSKNLKYNDKRVQDLEMNSEVNVVKELDGRLNVECSEQPLKATGIDLPDMYDVGPDTQMAAEAMEALFCAPPANYDTANLHPPAENLTTRTLRGVKKNETFSNNIPKQKKLPSSELGGTARRSKRTSKLDTKVTNGICVPSRENTKNLVGEKAMPVLAVHRRGKKGNVENEKHLSDENYVKGKGRKSRKSFEAIQHMKTLETRVRPNDKDKDSAKCNNSTISNRTPTSKEMQLHEECRTFTPIACRTRRSQAVNQSKRLSSTNGSLKGRKDSTEVVTRRGKRRDSSPLVDAPRPLDAKRKGSESGSTHVEEVRKEKMTQIQREGVVVVEKDRAETSYDNGRSLCYPRGKRTRCGVSTYLDEDFNVTSHSTVADGYEAIEQYIPRRKRSRIGLRGLVGDKPSSYLGKKSHADFWSTAEGAERYSVLNGVPGEQVKPSDTSITPTTCASLRRAVSPSCMGDDYHKQSSQKRKSRSSLMLEVRRLDANVAVSVHAVKDLRRRDMANVRVLLSHHLDDDVVKQQQKISERLGVPIVSSGSEATHFVTDKFARTKNMLESIALGKPVVTHLWLENCGLANSFIDEKSYILRDFKKEKEIGFSMPISLARACQNPLLQGKRIYVTPNVKPTAELVSSLVRTVQGQVVDRIGRFIKKVAKVPEDLLILSCEEDYKICAPLLEKGATVYSSELLLNGIVVQNLDYERHRLFEDQVNKTRSSKSNGNQFLPSTKCK